jgi:hypothetical protein
MAATQNEFIGIWVYCIAIKCLIERSLPKVRVYLCVFTKASQDFLIAWKFRNTIYIPLRAMFPTI